MPTESETKSVDFLSGLSGLLTDLIGLVCLRGSPLAGFTTIAGYQCVTINIEKLTPEADNLTYLVTTPTMGTSSSQNVKALHAAFEQRAKPSPSESRANSLLQARLANSSTADALIPQLDEEATPLASRKRKSTSDLAQESFRKKVMKVNSDQESQLAKEIRSIPDENIHVLPGQRSDYLRQITGPESFTFCSPFDELAFSSMSFQTAVDQLGELPQISSNLRSKHQAISLHMTSTLDEKLKRFEEAGQRYNLLAKYLDTLETMARNLRSAALVRPVPEEAAAPPPLAEQPGQANEDDGPQNKEVDKPMLERDDGEDEEEEHRLSPACIDEIADVSQSVSLPTIAESSNEAEHAEVPEPTHNVTLQAKLEKIWEQMPREAEGSTGAPASPAQNLATERRSHTETDVPAVPSGESVVDVPKSPERATNGTASSPEPQRFLERRNATGEPPSSSTVSHRAEETRDEAEAEPENRATTPAPEVIVKVEAPTPRKIGLEEYMRMKGKLAASNSTQKFEEPKPRVDTTSSAPSNEERETEPAKELRPSGSAENAKQQESSERADVTAGTGPPKEKQPANEPAVAETKAISVALTSPVATEARAPREEIKPAVYKSELRIVTIDRPFGQTDDDRSRESVLRKSSPHPHSRSQSADRPIAKRRDSRGEHTPIRVVYLQDAAKSPPPRSSRSSSIDSRERDRDRYHRSAPASIRNSPTLKDDIEEGEVADSWSGETPTSSRFDRNRRSGYFSFADRERERDRDRDRSSRNPVSPISVRKLDRERDRDRDSARSYSPSVSNRDSVSSRDRYWDRDRDREKDRARDRDRDPDRNRARDRERDRERERDWNDSKEPDTRSASSSSAWDKDRDRANP
ncbi:uncharacterized protein EV422DRAFT_244667 [Fimicolochytrium jonesii]|uniref:uncharacterized protein n=1 Tax=Fimicolochytrium jonesii TaxID=1396493 RepID=UPI0022FDDDF8|nr:uncharacterized protein EV422DRAFT_244667 [Fimicolochytrium jonesii]KAI8825086.1 hypothetical protein EV422DRAFT_244667 [Fimicolochytrium jonesii]